MFHTAFNLITTLALLPFVNQFAALVSWLVKDKEEPSGEDAPYKLEYQSGPMQNTPELNILRAEKDISDMAALVSFMYAALSRFLRGIKDTEDRAEAVRVLVEEMKRKEAYAGQMREALTVFLMECAREQLNSRSEQRVSQLLRIVAGLEDITDGCYGIGLLLERSVKKKQIFREKEMNALSPYMNLVGDFLAMLRECLDQNLTEEQIGRARKLEDEIDASRDKLRRLGRKRIEAGVDVKTELLFIDLVRRIEKLGDYCYDLAEALAKS
jgi:phosphate:Na+ symporter